MREKEGEGASNERSKDKAKDEDDSQTVPDEVVDSPFLPQSQTALLDLCSEISS